MKPFWSRLWAAIACVGGTLSFSNQSLLAAETGLIGSSLSTVEKTSDLFLFFNFASIGEEKKDDGTKITSFKPTGDAFRALVTLRATTDNQGVIQVLQLSIARSFIDDPTKCIYAADLAKSFLGNAAATSAGDAVDSLAREISVRTMARMTTTMINPQPVPKATGAPSDAYQTYAGDAHAQTLVYTSGKRQVVLCNVTQADGPALEITVSKTSKGI
jgi:hypothetical protein